MNRGAIMVCTLLDKLIPTLQRYQLVRVEQHLSRSYADVLSVIPTTGALS